MLGRRVGKYIILEEIGSGGMGVVYKARHLELGQKAAIKTLPPHLARDRQYLDRLVEEARTLAKLCHPNIVYIHDIEITDDDVYLIMEYIDGDTVADLLEQEGVFDASQAAVVVRCVASALSHTHDTEVIHRDIKPSNIMITPNDVVKVTDFGIAKSQEGPRLTNTGHTPGTVYYWSPEQARGKEILDGRSDIYSLGAVFYEMVTGRPPFSGDSDFDISEQHMRKPPPSPRIYAPELPVAYEKIILKCLEKNKGNRFQTANDLIDAIDRVEVTVPPGFWERLVSYFSQKRKQIAAIALFVIILAGIVYAINRYLQTTSVPPAVGPCVSSLNLNEPVGFVCAYFNDCQNKDAESAAKKRRDLSPETMNLLQSEIRNSEYYKIKDVSLLQITHNSAEVHTEYTYKRKGQKPITYVGPIFLKKNVFGLWEITELTQTVAKSP